MDLRNSIAAILIKQIELLKAVISLTDRHIAISLLRCRFYRESLFPLLNTDDISGRQTHADFITVPYITLKFLKWSTYRKLLGTTVAQCLGRAVPHSGSGTSSSNRSVPVSDST